jgi:hypothetical protein
VDDDDDPRMAADGGGIGPVGDASSVSDPASDTLLPGSPTGTSPGSGVTGSMTGRVSWAA